MRGGFAFSVGVHTLILLLILFGLPFLKVKPRDLPPMISVELVEMGKQTTTNKVSVANKVEKEPQEETPPPPPKPQTAPQPDPTPPQPTPPPSTPEPPKPREALDAMPKMAAVNDSVPELKTPDVNLRKQLPPAPELAQVDNKVADLAAPPKVDLKRPEPKKPTESFDAVLKNLTKNVPQPPVTQPPSPTAKAQAKPATGAQAPLAANLTASEMDALSQQLRQCWSLPAAAKDAQSLVVDLDLVVNPDRTVASVQVVDQSRMASDPAFRTAAEAARRALRMPQCKTLALPAEKYQEWQSMTLHFDPKEMLGQ